MSGATFLRGCRMRRRMHARLTRGGWLYEDVCAEHPRLTRTTSRASSRDPVTVTFAVDGAPVADLEEAERHLRQPPLRRDLFA